MLRYIYLKETLYLDKVDALQNISDLGETMPLRQVVPQVLKLIVPLTLAIVFFICFVMFIIRIDIERTLFIFASSEKRYFLIAIGFDIGFMVFYALAWYCLVRIISNEVKLHEAILVMMISWFGDMLIPAAFITGEAIRLAFLKRRYGIDLSKAAATVVVHRLLSTVAFVLFIFLGAAYLIVNGYKIIADVLLHAILFALLAVSLAILCSIVIFRIEVFESFSVKLFDKIIKLLKRRHLEKYRQHIEESLESFRLSMDMIKKKRLNVVLSFVNLIIQWICGIMIPYTFFRSVRYSVSFWLLAMAYPMYGVIDNIPFGVPANAGFLDAAMVSTFVLLGIDKEIATVVTWLTRMIIVVFEFILTGSITVIFGPKLFNISLSKLKELLRGREKLF